MKIALLGAESTGKSQLAEALCDRLQKSGLRVHRLDEYLRAWCDTHQRTPRKEEQSHIVDMQLASLQAAPADAVVIVDTTPLMTAVYSQMLFNDHSLDELAINHQAEYDVTLLTGLDLPWVSDGLQRDGPHVREPVDQKIRHMLALSKVPYQVVYGIGEQRLENALFCIGRQVPAWGKLLGRPQTPTRWSGPCETCGDGDCEHRLFTHLVKNKIS